MPNLLWIIWNFFLAAIPLCPAYCIAYYVANSLKSGKKPSMLLMAPLFLMWLIFLPNTCYLITEWRHFLFEIDSKNLYIQSQHDRTILLEICREALFYMFYSFTGLLLFVMGIRPLEKVATALKWPILIIAPIFFILMSLGVYLGLILRFNSWDLVTRTGDIYATIVNLLERPVLTGAILIFGVFLWGVYELLDICIDGVVERWSKKIHRDLRIGPNWQN